MPLMQLQHVTEIFAATDIVVIGTNPESADYDNPRGEIYGHSGYVIAVAPDGSRWVFNRSHVDYSESLCLERLESFVTMVKLRLQRGGKLDPRFWRETRPGCGSEAYANGGWSQEDAILERMEEEFA